MLKKTNDDHTAKINVQYDMRWRKQGRAMNSKTGFGSLNLQLHDAIYLLRFYSNSLTHILLLSNSHNNGAINRTV